MKKTQDKQQPQFIRERSVTPSNSVNDPMKLGSVYASNSKRRRYKKQKRLQLTLLLGAVSLIVIVAIFLAIKNNATKPPNSLLSNSSSTTAIQSGQISSDNFSAVNSTGISASGNSGTAITSGNSDSLVVSSSSGTPMSPAERAATFSDLQGEISAYANEFKGRIGVYYINLKNGETWGIGEKDPFVAASSIKLGINTLLYKNVAASKYLFTDMLTYNNKPYPAGDMEPGTGSIINSANGTKYSIRRTTQLSITISDNCATNMVIRKLGGIDTVVPYLSGISKEVPYRTAVTYTDYKGAVMSGRHRTCAKDLAMHAKNLYTLWIESKASYDPLMKDLESTVFKFGVPAMLPSSVVVAHKIGTNSDWRTENDVGIVFAKEPFVICVTTENSSQKTGRDAIAEISSMFYNYILGVS